MTVLPPKPGGGARPGGGRITGLSSGVEITFVTELSSEVADTSVFLDRFQSLILLRQRDTPGDAWLLEVASTSSRAKIF